MKDPRDTIKDLQQLEAFKKFTNGSRVMLPRTGTAYILENVHPTRSGVPQATIRRAFPKLSKAEKKRAKRAARGRARGLL